MGYRDAENTIHGLCHWIPLLSGCSRGEDIKVKHRGSNGRGFLCGMLVTSTFCLGTLVQSCEVRLSRGNHPQPSTPHPAGGVDGWGRDNMKQQPGTARASN